MGCGCATKTCGCDGASHAANGRTPIGARIPDGARSRSFPAPGVAATAEPRARASGPIGARSAVPLPPGFDGPAGKIRVPRAVMVQTLFGEADALVQAEASRLLEQVPFDQLPLVGRVLLETPVPFRLDRLMNFSRDDLRLEVLETSVAVSPLRTSLRLPQTAAPAGETFPPPCLVNDFDPRWGTPPATYHEIPLRFDAALGWYEFDEVRAHRDAARDSWGQPKWDPVELSRVASAYASSYALQPFKRAFAAPWDFRWISRVNRGVSCSSELPRTV